MIEHQFTEDRLAALYDRFYPPARRDDFASTCDWCWPQGRCLTWGAGRARCCTWRGKAAMPGGSADSIPAAGMLNQARQRSDIEWVHGDLASVRWEREFDLVVMTGHAFQEFVEDDEIRVALATIRSALTDDGASRSRRATHSTVRGSAGPRTIRAGDRR
jgi:hypothetical protein